MKVSLTGSCPQQGALDVPVTDGSIAGSLCSRLLPKPYLLPTFLHLAPFLLQCRHSRPALSKGYWQRWIWRNYCYHHSTSKINKNSAKNWIFKLLQSHWKWTSEFIGNFSKWLNSVCSMTPYSSIMDGSSLYLDDTNAGHSFSKVGQSWATIIECLAPLTRRWKTPCKTNENE